MNQLAQLKTMTTVVADSSDFQSIQAYSPQDATTNPSLIYKAAQNPKYRSLIEKASHNASSQEEALDNLFLYFGSEILKVIPGKVSIEIDATLSFNTHKSIEKAKKMIALFEQHQIPRSRILIKLASTWEGIMAAKELEKENIHCNMTLLFSLVQAAAAAEAGAYLISPFVGRILDWHKKTYKKDYYLPHEDPGVLSVTRIYEYYKHFNYPTKIMAASFRNKEEILELAGCDLLTISPTLLKELQNDKTPITQKLQSDACKALKLQKLQINEDSFQEVLKEDPMPFEKLHEGIEIFSSDLEKLKKEILSDSKKLLLSC